jgi:predicted dehydrogenase
VKECRVPFQIGFDSRFDPAHAEVKRQIDAGALGQLDQFLSVSRDPVPPTKEYMAKSGGLSLSPDATDAIESLRIGVAATRSLREGRPVKIAEVGTEQVRET